VLELKAGNPFRIRAYRRAAQNLEALSEDVERLAREERLEEIPHLSTYFLREASELPSETFLDAAFVLARRLACVNARSRRIWRHAARARRPSGVEDEPVMTGHLGSLRQGS